MTQVFVSYARQDVARVRPIVDALEAHDVDVWWDQKLRPGDPFHERIEQELADSGCVVVCWSARSRGSRWVLDEARRAMGRGVLVPIRLDGLLPLGHGVVHTIEFEHWKETPSEDPFIDLLGSVESCLSGTPRPTLRCPARPVFGGGSNLSGGDESSWTGRNDELVWLDQALNRTGSVAVVSGAPGIGKSALARRFALRRLSDYPGGCFRIEGRGGGLLSDQLRDVAVTHVGLTDAVRWTLPQLFRAFAQVGPTLLIFDDLLGPDSLKERDVQLLPAAGLPIDVLITTNFGGWWQTEELELRALPFDEAQRLCRILVGQRSDSTQTAKLAMAADGNLVLLSAWAKFVWSKLRHRREVSEGDLIEEILTHAGDTFEGPWRNLSDEEQKRLGLVCRLSLAGVSPALVAEIEGVPFSVEAFDRLTDLNLVQGNDERRQVPGALAAWVRRRAPLDAHMACRLRIRLVDAARQALSDPHDRNAAAILWALGSHAGFVEEAFVEPRTQRFPDLLAVGDALLQAGAFDEARSWHERAAGVAQEGDEHGQINHHHVAEGLHGVGVGFCEQHRYEEALPWCERAVAEHRLGIEFGGTERIKLGQSLHQLGWCLTRLDRFGDALPWLQQAIGEYLAGDGQGRIDHTELGKTYFAVGLYFSGQEDYARARGWYEDAVDAFQRGNVSGRVDHECLATGYHQIGLCLSRTEQFAEALSHYERAATGAGLGDVFGRVNHQAVGVSLHQSALCLRKLGREEEAQARFEQAVTEMAQGDVYGRVNHWLLALALDGVAGSLERRSMVDEAREWRHRAEKACELV
ncbi:MAG: tetratricopeptide repeat protein [Myxococcota bacterium]